MRFLAVITLLILALALAQPVAAQSFKPYYWLVSRAYDEKDYATALKHFRPLAKQGDADAQDELGTMYQYGWGVTKDYKEAVRWVSKWPW
jgi:TPR repeat protein